MARDKAQVWRDWLAAGAALVVIVGGAGAFLGWVVEGAAKEAVAMAVKNTVLPAVDSAVGEAVPRAVEMAVEKTVLPAVDSAVNEAVPRAVKGEIRLLEESVKMLLSDVEALKRVQALTWEGWEGAGNPAVSAALFPEAPWVPKFETWAENLPPGQIIDMWTMPLRADPSEPWVAAYQDWYEKLTAANNR